MAENVNLRAVVLDVLEEILENKKYSHVVLNQALLKYQYLDRQERAFINRLAMGTLENRIYLEYVIQQFSKIKISKMKPVIRNILLLSVYQLLYMENIPASAAVNEAVKLVQSRGLSGLKPFVNGVLRNISRQKESFSLGNMDPHTRLSIQYSMPEWIVKEWLDRYGVEITETILSAFLKEKRTYIRALGQDIQKLQESLGQRGIQTERAPYVGYALYIKDYNYLNSIPEFLAGKFTIQDLSSMLVGVIANPQKGSFVLDVCSAPGGKATHMAQLMEGTGRVLARDLTEAKLERIVQNAERMRLTNLEAQVYDATQPDEEMVEQADILICDLPCSGLGIIGRKPDIKYRMTKEQQKELVTLQRRILNTVYRYVKPGGRMIFSTCTISRMENEENTKWILEHLPFEEDELAGQLPTELLKHCCSAGSIQLLPGVVESDGFYISAFRRVR